MDELTRGIDRLKEEGTQKCDPYRKTRLNEITRDRFEALIGYLYLIVQTERLNTLFEIMIGNRNHPLDAIFASE